MPNAGMPTKPDAGTKPRRCTRHDMSHGRDVDADPDAQGHADDSRVSSGSRRRSHRFFPARAWIRRSCRPRSRRASCGSSDGDTLDLTAMLVRRTINGHTFAMYGFNGQVPGPLIRVPQNATITVRFHNRIDLPSTVHWHGVRLDNRFDGVPGLTQDSVAPGGDFVYTVHFPDAGIYWYHPHVREDIEQAMGLFGNMLVDSPERDYYSPANREQTLVLDDLLVNADTLIPFGKEAPDFALMGRVGNVLLVNGEPRYTLAREEGRGRAVLPHERLELAHVQPLVRRRADQSRRVRREPLRARGARAERGARAGRALRRRGALRQARAATRVVNAIQAINHYRRRVRARGRHARRRHRRRRAGDAGLRASSSRRCAPNAAGDARHRPVSAVLRQGARQDADAHRRDERAAARDRAVHERRHGVLRARGVGRRHAGHELAVDQRSRCAGFSATTRPARRTWTSTGTSRADRS